MVQETDSNSLNNHNISRRSFLKATAATVGVLVVSGYLPDAPKSQPTPKLSGIIPNCAYLPFLPLGVQGRMIENMNACGATGARVFLDDRFEPSIGNYQMGYLDQVASLSRRMPITLDLFDGYHLLHKSEPDSPYLGKGSRNLYERQMDILIDEEVQRAYLKRTSTIVDRLKDEPGILAWGLANELNLNRNQYADVARPGTLSSFHTKLFDRQIQTILSLDDKRPILIGVDDPNLVDEEELSKFDGRVFNTIHVYPTTEHEEMISNYLSNEHLLPLVCQEVGFSRALLRQEDGQYDSVLAGYLKNIFTKLDPYIVAFGPWRLTGNGDSHSDGYEINPMEMSETLETIRQVGNLLT
jgi:hypothetical protein